jgi:hypothetical protein
MKEKLMEDKRETVTRQTASVALTGSLLCISQEKGASERSKERIFSYTMKSVALRARARHTVDILGYLIEFIEGDPTHAGVYTTLKWRSEADGLENRGKQNRT